MAAWVKEPNGTALQGQVVDNVEEIVRQPLYMKILGHVLLLNRLGNNWDPLLHCPGEADLSPQSLEVRIVTGLRKIFSVIPHTWAGVMPHISAILMIFGKSLDVSLQEISGIRKGVILRGPPLGMADPDVLELQGPAVRLRVGVP